MKPCYKTTSRWCRLVFAGVLGFGIAARAAADDAGWIPLFDGQSLEGWQASENQGGFKLANGTIVFEGKRSHLFYVGKINNADFKNFEFQTDVRTEPLANSGIYFHTEYQESDWPRKGFEVQVANTHLGAGGYVEMKKTGSLYGVRNLYRAVARDNEWFTIRVVVRGRRIQVHVNNRLVVDYVEPENLVAAAGRRLSRGTFALQGHDPESRVAYRNIRVKPLPDDLPADFAGTVRFDAVDEQIVKLSTANYPLVDFHTHLKGGLTIGQVMQHTFSTGINHGVAVNCGLGFAITNDAGIDAFLKSMTDLPMFVGMQAEGREWTSLFSPAAVALFDYVFTDSMTLPDHRGRRMRLWINEEVDIPDKQAFMDHLVNTIVKILTDEPVDIYVNPTFLPDILASDYDALWTTGRMRRVIDAAKQQGVAIEINSRYRLPSLAFIKLAKQAGLKFTLGSNNVDARLDRAEYGLEMIRAAGLTYRDFWMPKPEGQKPVQTKRRL